MLLEQNLYIEGDQPSAPTKTRCVQLFAAFDLVLHFSWCDQYGYDLWSEHRPWYVSKESKPSPIASFP